MGGNSVVTRPRLPSSLYTGPAPDPARNMPGVHPSVSVRRAGADKYRFATWGAIANAKTIKTGDHGIDCCVGADPARVRELLFEYHTLRSYRCSGNRKTAPLLAQLSTFRAV